MTPEETQRRIGNIDARITQLATQIKGLQAQPSTSAGAAPTGPTILGDLASRLKTILNNGFEWIGNQVNVKAVPAGGIIVAPSGLSVDWSLANHLVSVNASGSAYSLTITPALLNFGTTDPIITVDKAGTYLIKVGVQINRNNSTQHPVSGMHSITMKVRRTNNTPADIISRTYVDDDHTASNETEGEALALIPEFIYATANTNDILQIWGSLDVLDSLGSHDVVQVDVIAMRVY